jgi:serine/threonine protein phosphatase PrpC
MSKKVLVSHYTNKGIRDKNEDNYCICKNKANQILLVVADGIGGEIKGDIASGVIVKVFENNFKNRDLIKDFKDFFIKCSDEIIFHINKYSHNGNQKMGSTVNAVLITDRNVESINLGDTRTYQYVKTTNKIRQISLDQNLENFIISKFNAEKIAHPENAAAYEKEKAEWLASYDAASLKALTNCIEANGKITIADCICNNFTIADGDQVIVLTDGVYN